MVALHAIQQYYLLTCMWKYGYSNRHSVYPHPLVFLSKTGRYAYWQGVLNQSQNFQTVKLAFCSCGCP